MARSDGTRPTRAPAASGRATSACTLRSIPSTLRETLYSHRRLRLRTIHSVPVVGPTSPSSGPGPRRSSSRRPWRGRTRRVAGRRRRRILWDARDRCHRCAHSVKAAAHLSRASSQAPATNGSPNRTRVPPPAVVQRADSASTSSGSLTPTPRVRLIIRPQASSMTTGGQGLPPVDERMQLILQGILQALQQQQESPSQSPSPKLKA
jgi:hypothetical protein